MRTIDERRLNKPGTKSYRNGLEMWNDYGQGIHYNPMEGLHIEYNTHTPDHIENKIIGHNEKHDDDIIQCRDYLLRVRIQDTILTNVSDEIYNRINEQYEIKRQQNPDHPQLWQEWDDFTEEETKQIVTRYVGLLDPLTLRWIDPEHPEVVKDDDGNYLFNREPPTHELDTTFLYKETNPLKDNDYDWYTIYYYVEEDFLELLPPAIRQMNNDYIEGNDYSEES